jgi:1,4-alpha-glucan branching enzyme
VVREAYTVGVPEAGTYEVIFNSDSHYYGGGNVGLPAFKAYSGEWHGFPAHVSASIPPLGALYLKLKKD